MIGDFELNWTSPGGAPSLIPTRGLEKRLDLVIKYPENEEKYHFARAYAVHIHAFYVEDCISMLDRLAHVCATVDLWLTTDSVEKKDQISAAINYKNLASSFGDVHIIVVPNSGRNVYPLLARVLPELRDYSFALHLHTKRSSHSPKGSMWCADLINCLVADVAHVKKICAAFEGNPSLGLILPRCSEEIRPFWNWGKNFEMAQLLCRNAFPERSLRITAPLIFPAGMMFWFRPQSLQGLHDMIRLWDKPPYEPLPADGTYLHAIERLVVHSCEAAGFDWCLCCPPSEYPLLTECSAVSISVWQQRVDEYVQATSYLAVSLRELDEKQRIYQELKSTLSWKMFELLRAARRRFR